MDVNEFVKRHHGLVWIESTKGAGSTFWWNLPLRGMRGSFYLRRWRIITDQLEYIAAVRPSI